jgi:glycosyltransferase involved in cell wall biosynthesis
MKIMIWTGRALETWGLDSVVSGIGGSETAAVRLSEALARLGHVVSVVGRVNPCLYVPEGAKAPGRVRYESYDPGAPKVYECDVFVSSREPEIWSKIDVRCQVRALWLHDATTSSDLVTCSREYDTIFCLSNWAKRSYMNQFPDLPAEKLVVTRNGIDPSRFLQSGETLDNLRPVSKAGRTSRMIYSSSPDRGLKRLLDLWPRIRAEVSDATLGIFYGADNVRLAAQQSGRTSDRDTLAQIEYLVHRAQSMEDDGVHYFGRVGQSELAQAFLESSLWVYPTHFEETSCITAMEAQAAAAYPITSAVGALPETCRVGDLIYPPFDSDYDEAFVEAVVHACGDGRQTSRELAEAGRELALRNLTWDGVADLWEALFESKLGGAS